MSSKTGSTSIGSKTGATINTTGSKTGATTNTTGSKTGGESVGSKMGAASTGLVSGTGDVLNLAGTSMLETLQYGKVKSTDAVLSQTAEGWTVNYTASYTNSKSGSPITVSGTDTLTGIERLAFADKTLALDVQDTQSAAGAALAVYQAAFNTQPDATTLGYWINTADHSIAPSSKSGSNTQTPSTTPNASLTTSIAEAALSHYAQGGIGNDALVGLLYKNLTGHDADTGTIRAFSSQIENGTYSQASLIALAAEQPQTQVECIGLVGQGVAYTPYSGSKVG